MIMKTTYNILIAGLLSVLAFTSCEGFLDKFPETALSPETFYTNEKELTLATNGFYAMLPKPDDTFDGALQDNDLQFHLSLSAIQRGIRQAETETWSASTWSDLRSINYYLEHSVKCTNEDVRKKYDGIAYFFRAVFYYEKVRKYGDIPFYDHVISDSDKESLYRPRDSRGFVMQKIMEDLDRAIDGLPVTWSEGVYRINKYAAYALKSRIALFEGTWRKYHDIADESYTKEDGTTLTLSSAYFLQLAADAAKAVMESGKYKMYNGSTIVKGQPYRDYFVLEDAETGETILSRRFLYTAEMQTMQVNVTYKCNLACNHCYLECGPKNTQCMSRETMEAVLAAFKTGGYKTMDITGGSPEMNPDIEWFIGEASKIADEVIVRSNLVILQLPDYKHFMDVYVRNKVKIVSSLPYFTELGCDGQRGSGVFRNVMRSLHELNDRGYGVDPALQIDLVYNVDGPFLPPDQRELEDLYKYELQRAEGVKFNGMYAFNNYCLGRFANQMKDQQKYEYYLDLLAENYNAATVARIMCRTQINVDYDGGLYDCEVNHVLGLPIDGPKNVRDIVDKPLEKRRIATSPICYSCSAGCGSSCGGSLLQKQMQEEAAF